MQNGNREVYMDICAWSEVAFMVPKLIVTADTVFMYLFQENTNGNFRL